MHPEREIRKLAKSFRNAFAGMAEVVRNERNFRIHICMMFYVVVFSIIGEVPKSAMLCFLLCFGAVAFAEMFNTAIEKLCDAVEENFDERIRTIKDIAAGGVLVVALFSAIIGLFVFLSPDIFGRIIETICRVPVIGIVIALSLPIAVLFVLKRGK